MGGNLSSQLALEAVRATGARATGPVLVTKALAELIQDDMDNDAVGIPTDPGRSASHCTR